MEIIISPIHKTFFTGRLWYGLDIEKIAAILTNTYGHRVTIIDFTEVASDYDLIPQGACWFYTPSYNEHYNRYVRDVITDFDRSRKDVVLIPDLDQLFSFENKGYQELYKRRLGIEHVKGRYFGDQDEFVIGEQFDYPFVLKKINGAASSGVRLIKNDQELKTYFKRDKRRSLIDCLRFWKRRYISWKKGSIPSEGMDLMNYNKFFAERSPFVIQEFIPDLSYDYKVLVFGNKYYVLKRWNRPNDFRASGSEKFEKNIPPSTLLNYAEEISKKIDTPFCSLDIAYTNRCCALIEFQGAGFGPSTLTNSLFYFTRNANTWEQVEKISNLEEEYAYAIHDFLTRTQARKR